jgi:hypothetical protein
MNTRVGFKPLIPLQKPFAVLGSIAEMVSNGHTPFTSANRENSVCSQHEYHCSKGGVFM